MNQFICSNNHIDKNVCSQVPYIGMQYIGSTCQFENKLIYRKNKFPIQILGNYYLSTESFN